MIIGTMMPGRHPIVSLIVKDVRGQDVVIDALVDTGYNGVLLLPKAVVASLGLPLRRITSALLADGARVSLQSHEGRILWDGRERVVRVLAGGNQPLLGLALLTGYNLSLDVVDGGPVRITPLAAGAAS